MNELGRRFYFEKFIYNKKVVIYGASATGYAIYQQLQMDGCAKVIAIVDKNANKVQYEYNCPLITPHIFFDEYLYDYILVASSSSNTQQVIKEYLIRNNVKESCIIFLEESFCDGRNEYRMIDNPNIALRQLLDVNVMLVGDVELTKHFQLWMKQYYNKLSDKETFINEIRTSFYMNPDHEIRILLGLYLFELTEYTSADMKKLIESIEKLSEDKYEWLYYLCTRLTLMELYQNKFLYRELGVQRKRLWNKVANYNKGYDSKIAIRRVERVAILVRVLGDENCSVSTIYRTMANELLRNGKEVKLFVIPYAVKESYGFLSSTEGLDWTQSEKCKDRNRKLINSKVEIEYIVEENIYDMLNSVTQKVWEYQPGCIVDAMDELCPVSALLYKRYPIFNLALRSCTSGTYFTKTSARIFEYNEEIIPYVVELPVVSAMKQQKHSYSKEVRYNIPKESFVIVSVGNRLSYELDQELVDCLLGLMDKKRDMYWIVVGDLGVSKYFVGKRNSDSIRIVEYEEDIMALYELCDVFLNPDRIGGGYSIKFAMQQGVVVVALKKNLRGAAKWVGEEELIDGGYMEQIQYIERLYSDSVLLSEKKERMRKLSRGQCREEEWGVIFNKVLNDMMETWEDINDTI